METVAVHMAYESRIGLVECIAEAGPIRRCVKSLVVVGSVGCGAMYPEAVTDQSDLNLLAVCDFGRSDLRELFDYFGQEDVHRISNLARAREVDCFSIRIAKKKKIPTTFYIWDKSALLNVTDAPTLDAEQRKPNRQFMAAEYSAMFAGGELISPTGMKKWFYDERAFPGATRDRIYGVYSLLETRDEIYLGRQATMFCLLPQVIFDTTSYVKDHIASFRSDLLEILKRKYGSEWGNTASLWHTLPQWLQNKLPVSYQRLLRKM